MNYKKIILGWVILTANALTASETNNNLTMYREFTTLVTLAKDVTTYNECKYCLADLSDEALSGKLDKWSSYVQQYNSKEKLNNVLAGSKEARAELTKNMLVEAIDFQQNAFQTEKSRVENSQSTCRNYFIGTSITTAFCFYYAEVFKRNGNINLSFGSVLFGLASSYLILSNAKLWWKQGNRYNLINEKGCMLAQELHKTATQL